MTFVYLNNVGVENDGRSEGWEGGIFAGGDE